MEFIEKNCGPINVIFLHGWGADCKSFMFLQNELTGFRLHFANLDGFGGTPSPQDETISGYSERLKQYIQQNGLKNVVLVGHSFGGRVAIEYAAKNSLLGLVLVDSAGVKPHFSLKKQLKIWRYKLTKKLVSAKIMPTHKLNKFGSPDYINSDSQMKKVLICCVNYDMTPLLKDIQAPTLIIWGKNDKETPIYMAKTLQKSIKNSKLIIMKDCGHFSFLDNQFLFFENLKSFLNCLRRKL